jgi:hypothetical protein
LGIRYWILVELPAIRNYTKTYYLTLRTLNLKL